MELKTWLLFILTDFIVNITPGPAVILVSTQGLKYGARRSFFGAIGITASSFVYFALSAFGLIELIVAAGSLFDYIKYAGAVYLVYSGLSMLYSAFKAHKENAAAIPKHASNFRLFMQGFITEMANPKAILFFVALLPMFIDAKGDVLLQCSILGLSSIIMETAVLFAYGYLADKGQQLVGQNVLFTKIKDSIAGLMLMGIGINLFFLRRS